MKPDINDCLKPLIFKERTDFEEAMLFPICKILYSKVLAVADEENARKEVMALYNDALWLTCQKYVDVIFTTPLIIDIQTDSQYYNGEWVLALWATTKNWWMEQDDMEKHPEMLSLINESKKITDHEDLYLNDWGFPEDVCPITYAPIKEWGDLHTYDWEEITAYYNIELLNQLYSVAQDNIERKKIYEVIMRDAKISYGEYLKEEDVYLWLCKIKVDLQERGVDKNINERTLCEKTVLNIKSLDIELLRRTIQLFIKRRTIKTDARSGYVWYAVWLFFKKNGILKNSSQTSFRRLMESWFPGKGYGNDDLMRNYNSDYLEKYQWQIWKYVEFKKTAKKKASERGFNQIKWLYSRLEMVLVDHIWQYQE